MKQRRTALVAALVAAITIAATLLLPGCGDGTIDAQALCEAYAQKLVDCAAIDASEQANQTDSCVVILSEGGDATSYQCVVDSECAEVATCEI